jgi:hypothetical protein
LDKIPEAVKFVQALQDQGDYTILWTGSSISEIQGEIPGLAEIMDRIVRKDRLGRELFEDLSYQDIEVTEVVILDDDPGMGMSMVGSCNFAIPNVARYVNAQDWETLILEEKPDA